MRARRGVSLVELLVVLSACSFILTTSAVFLHRAMGEQSRSRSFLAAERSALRLSEQFRRDVHQAREALLTDLPDTVVLRLKVDETRTVEYRRVAGVVSRTSLANAQIESRDEFEFPPQIDFAVRRIESPPRLSLSITTVPRAPDNPGDGLPIPSHATPANFLFEACLGRDSRFVEVTTDREVPE